MPGPVHQALILVGGKGTRLGEVTRTVPKPLIEIVEGKAFLDFLIEQLLQQGVKDIVLLAGYLGHLFRARYERLKFGPARVRVIVESSVRGTGGALLEARDILEPRFLLLNGDSFFDIDLDSLAMQAETSNSQALLALRRISNASRYGTVDLQGNCIVGFRERGSDRTGPALINAGVYVLTRAILENIRALPCSLETDVFPALAAAGRLSGTVREGYFVDIGLPEALEVARRELPKLRRFDSYNETR